MCVTLKYWYFILQFIVYVRENHCCCISVAPLFAALVVFCVNVYERKELHFPVAHRPPHEAQRVATVGTITSREETANSA